MANLSGLDSVAPRLSRGPLAEAAKAVQLITAVETDFKIKFNLRELMAMKNVGDMIDLIDSHMNKS